MKFNDDAALKLANTIVPLYEQRKSPFDIKSCETILPEGMEERSKEHALYLFYTAIGNFAVDAEKFYKSSRKFYDKHPKYFEPETVIKEFTIDADEYNEIKRVLDGKEVTVNPQMKDLIKDNLGGRWWEIGKRWWNNSIELEKYDFDPRNIFEEDDTIESVFKKLDGKRHPKTKIQHGFRGLKQKIGNMLINQYLEADITKVIDPENAKVPVDYHAINIMIAQGVLTDFENGIRDTPVAAFLQPELSRFSRENKINGLSFAKAIWETGKYVCAYNNSNNTCPLPKCNQIIEGSTYFDSGKIIVVDNPRGC